MILEGYAASFQLPFKQNQSPEITDRRSSMRGWEGLKCHKLAKSHPPQVSVAGYLKRQYESQLYTLKPE